MNSISLLIGHIINFLIAFGAYKKGSLTLSGSIAAFILGALLLLTSGIYGFSLALVFFISSSALTKYRLSYKKSSVELRFEKSGTRDMYQVIANGGVALLFSILYFLYQKEVFLIALAVAFATTNADTWATETGVLSGREPLFLRNFRRVPRGTSGAVSLRGSIFAFLGSSLVALTAVSGIYLLKVIVCLERLFLIFIVISVGGFIGSFVDSFLGAFVQGIYFSEIIGETEKRFYNGVENKLIRGLKFINNDVVNFLSSFAASLLVFFIVWRIL